MVYWHAVTCGHLVVVQDRVPPLRVGTAALIKFGVGEKADWREGENVVPV